MFRMLKKYPFTGLSRRFMGIIAWRSICRAAKPMATRIPTSLFAVFKFFSKMLGFDMLA